MHDPTKIVNWRPKFVAHFLPGTVDCRSGRREGRLFGTLRPVHPMERLRYLARANDVPQQLLVEEAAAALSSVAHEHHALVMSCRQMLSHHPTSGALVALAARMLTSDDARQEAWRVVEEVHSDLTTEHLIDSFPSPSAVYVSGWSEHLDAVLAGRPDVRPTGRLEDADILLVDADAGGPFWFLAPMGVNRVVAAARAEGLKCWAVAAYGSVLPKQLFDAASDRAGDLGEVLELSDFDMVIGPDGPQRVAGRPLASSCPLAAELA